MRACAPLSDLANLRSTAKPKKQGDTRYVILKEMSAWWFNTGFSIMDASNPTTRRRNFGGRQIYETLNHSLTLRRLASRKEGRRYETAIDRPTDRREIDERPCSKEAVKRRTT